MTNLPVFEDLSGELFIQISAKHLSLGRVLLVSAVRATSREAGSISVSEAVRVPFGNEIILVLYLIVGSAPTDLVATRLKQIGQLEEADSINILNHIVDILAYP